ncbi:MAG: hypothetical protein CEO19_327 [Parcubacteria group bacterium Gr01-1014_73]|nr:MAG: hypothetical protein CEO19_327 [Parcubacteria group bacterium Gr01-1014_73]
MNRAFEKINRVDFIGPDYQAEADEDYPLPIGFGQTISQPFTVAFMLELLEPQKGDKVLDVGSGSGWTTALLAELVGDMGRVFGVEKIPELVSLGRKNLAKYNFPNAKIIQAGAELGLPSEAPFDKILVSAAAEKIPETLLYQLKAPGLLVLPVKDAIIQIKKDAAGKIFQKEFPGFVFVPLV